MAAQIFYKESELSSHYGSMFTVERIEMMAHLGYYDDERARRQPVEITFRLYFPKAPECFGNDTGKFIDYQKVIVLFEEMIITREYRLIEYLTHQLYQVLREFLDVRGEQEVKIWMAVTKLKPDIPQMQGGAKYIYCDLPNDAVIVHAC